MIAGARPVDAVVAELLVLEAVVLALELPPPVAVGELLSPESPAALLPPLLPLLPLLPVLSLEPLEPLLPALPLELLEPLEPPLPPLPPLTGEGLGVPTEAWK